VARVAKEFGVLPSVVARDLDEDPEQTSLVALHLLNYATAKAEYDGAGGDMEKLKHWKDSELMATVKTTSFEMMRARLEHRKTHRGQYHDDCRLCRTYAREK
jgi:predicted RNA polymerase sigma factor